MAGLALELGVELYWKAEAWQNSKGKAVLLLSLLTSLFPCLHVGSVPGWLSRVGKAVVVRSGGGELCGNVLSVMGYLLAPLKQCRRNNGKNAVFWSVFLCFLFLFFLDCNLIFNLTFAALLDFLFFNAKNIEEQPLRRSCVYCFLAHCQWKTWEAAGAKSFFIFRRSIQENREPGKSMSSHTQYPLFTGPGRRAAHPSLEARLKLQPETSLVAVPFKPFKLQTCGF